MSSAYFSLGSLFLDKSDRVQAKLNFDHAIKITQDILVKYLKEKGQSFETEEIDTKKLIEPSIFDDDTIQDLKATLVEMVEFVKECQDMEKMQPELDKLKAEAQKKKAENGEEVDVPESFGQVPVDASTFAPVKIKSKKRTLEQMQKGDEAAYQKGGELKKVEEDPDKENKLRKLNQWFENN